MIIYHSRRFIFVHIHKAGGTSVELGLEPFLAWCDLLLGSSEIGERMSSHYDARFGLGKHGSIADIERVCGEKICRDYHVFATVRHPLERLCSLYNYIGSIVHAWAQRWRIAPGEVASRLAQGAPSEAPSLNWPASRVFLGTADFSAFIRSAELAADPGFLTQASRLRSSKAADIRVRALRLEESAAWLPRMRKTLGVEFALPHSNKSRLKLVTGAEVSAADREFVAARFAEDYAVFGYQP